jgi:cytochrome c
MNKFYNAIKNFFFISSISFFCLQDKIFAKDINQEEINSWNIPELIKSANSENGLKIFKTKCMQCHSIEKNMPNKQGPNLYGIFEQAIASNIKFKYSDALMEKKNDMPDEKEKIWNEKNLLLYLNSPKNFLGKSGKMVFAGLKKQDELIDLLAYLKTKKD